MFRWKDAKVAYLLTLLIVTLVTALWFTPADRVLITVVGTLYVCQIWQAYFSKMLLKARDELADTWRSRYDHLAKRYAKALQRPYVYTAEGEEFPNTMTAAVILGHLRELHTTEDDRELSNRTLLSRTSIRLLQQGVVSKPVQEYLALAPVTTWKYIKP